MNIFRSEHVSASRNVLNNPTMPLQNLTEIVQLLDDAKLESKRASSSAKAKVETERCVGLEMREAAMKNLVQARELKEDLSAIEGSSYRERQGQRKRYVLVNFQPVDCI